MIRGGFFSRTQRQQYDSQSAQRLLRRLSSTKDCRHLRLCATKVLPPFHLGKVAVIIFTP